MTIITFATALILTATNGLAPQEHYIISGVPFSANITTTEYHVDALNTNSFNPMGTMVYSNGTLGLTATGWFDWTNQRFIKVFDAVNENEVTGNNGIMGFMWGDDAFHHNTVNGEINVSGAGCSMVYSRIESGSSLSLTDGASFTRSILQAESNAQLSGAAGFENCVLINSTVQTTTSYQRCEFVNVMNYVDTSQTPQHDQMFITNGAVITVY